MTYKELFEALRPFAEDKEYGKQEVDVYLKYSNRLAQIVESVTIDGEIVIQK